MRTRSAGRARLDKRTLPKDTAGRRPLHLLRSALPNPPTARTTLTLASTLQTVDRVEHEAERFAQQFGFDDDELSNIAMAVREAAVNAVMHGNAYSNEREVSVAFEATASDLIFRIGDQGAGFDPSGIPDPLSPENILRGSGRGVFLMRAFMDEVHFRQLSPGTELTLIKHRTDTQANA